MKILLIYQKINEKKNVSLKFKNLIILYIKILIHIIQLKKTILNQLK